MPNSLKQLCDSAQSSRYQQALPGYEKTHRYFKKKEGFIYFIHHELPKNKVQNGWKFHLSMQPDQMERAWGLIGPILLAPDSNILAFKVLDLNSSFGNTRDKKQVIIYTFKSSSGKLLQSAKDIYITLLKIEKALRAGKISPGSTSSDSLKIPGSRYISTRHDLNLATDHYISPLYALDLNKENPHNPLGYDNPYAFFTMSNLTRRFFSLRGTLFHDGVLSKRLSESEQLENTEKIVDHFI